MGEIVSLDELLGPAAPVERIAQYLVVMPHTSDFLELRSESVDTEQQLGYRIKGTRVFVRVNEFRTQRGPLVVAAAAFAEQTSSLAAWAALAAIVIDRISALSPTEAMVLDTLCTLAHGKPYTRGVGRERLRAELSDSIEVEELIDKLVNERYLIESSDGLKMAF